MDSWSALVSPARDHPASEEEICWTSSLQEPTHRITHHQTERQALAGGWLTTTTTTTTWAASDDGGRYGLRIPKGTRSQVQLHWPASKPSGAALARCSAEANVLRSMSHRHVLLSNVGQVVVLSRPWPRSDVLLGR